MNDFQRRRILSWAFVLAWTVFIYTSAVFAVPVAREMFTYLNMNAVMVLAFTALMLGAFFFLKKNRTRIAPVKVGLLLLLVAAFALEYYFAERHAKRFHLIEYSILSVLFYRALRWNVQGVRLWFLTFAGTVLVGLGDEVLQRWIPNRVSAFPDILINVKGALFGLIFLFLTRSSKASPQE